MITTIIITMRFSYVYKALEIVFALFLKIYLIACKNIVSTFQVKSE